MDESFDAVTAGEARDAGAMATRLAEVAALLRGARQPVLFCHRSPDGDTVGAALGLARALRHLGQEPAVVCADPLPPSLHFLPGSATIATAVPDDPDLLVTVDVSDLGLLGDVRADLERLRPGRTLLNIDHHASDTEYGDVNLVDTTAASTAEIVYDLVAAFPAPVDRDMAMLLLTGIINDTHSFQNANSTTRALATAASLVAAGADAAMISYNLLLRRRPQAALLWGRVLATLRLDDAGRVASAVATREMIDACEAETSDLDGVVEFLRSIDGVDLAFLLKGMPDGHFKASVRTTTRVDAVELTAAFGGGGHRRAAGCDLPGPPEDARAVLIARYHQLVGSRESGVDVEGMSITYGLTDALVAAPYLTPDSRLPTARSAHGRYPERR